MQPDPPLVALARNVRRIYFDRFDELTLEYQLHFASRLYSWCGDETAAQKLSQLKAAVLPADSPGQLSSLQAIRTELAHKDFVRDVNNYAARRPYFDMYPELLLLHTVLFRIRHWYCVYGVDARDLLFQLIPQHKIELLLHRLWSDPEAIRVLSTYAINTFYLYEKLYQKPIVDIKALQKLCAGYDRNDPYDVQLLLYLYTHCILGETLFYFQPIAKRLSAYLAMLEEIDNTIASRYDTITLDNKFEFLVCSRVCNFTPTVSEQIYREALQSTHNEGFIVDTHSKHSNPVKQTFLMSEHRNVLFIMSTTQPKFVSQPVI